MLCDVCDHEMVKLDRPPTRWCRESWHCPWCHAWTQFETPEFDVLRPGHMPWDLRWEAAWTDMLPEAGHHAYGGFHQTLCGIERPDMEGSQFGMWGGADDDCPDCTAAALNIDARWPEDRRETFRVSVRALPKPRPEDEPGYVQPADELGRLDIRLPEILPATATRVLATSILPREAHDGFQTIGDGPGSLRLPASWVACGIGPYRPRDWLQGYGAYSLDSLPPLDEATFVGDFAWIGEIGDPLDYRIAVTDPIAAELAEAGLTLPADFVVLITRANLHRLLDTKGAGNWTDVVGPLPSPADSADRMVLFFRDQQSCVMWYLYLRHSGESFVVWSYQDFTREPKLRYNQDGAVVTPRQEINWCAPSVESFAYRYLIEERLNAAIRDKERAKDLAPELLAYLAHYVSGCPEKQTGI
ncbi:hypothetical protein ACWD4F_21770 [Streptomyces aureus]